MKLLSHYIEHQKTLYPEIINWKNHIVGDMLSYSYRDTVYDRRTILPIFTITTTMNWSFLKRGTFNMFARGAFIIRNTEILFLSPGKFICP